MYQVYQHTTQPAYRLIKAKTGAMPEQAAARDWKLVREAETVWPEAKQEIDALGYFLYRAGAKFSEIPTTAANVPKK